MTTLSRIQVAKVKMAANKHFCLRRLIILIFLSDCNWTRTQNHLVLKRVRDMTRTYSLIFLLYEKEIIYPAVINVIYEH